VTHNVDLDALSTDSPFRGGFYPNSHREKRKNALKVRSEQGKSSCITGCAVV